ncbi:MAG: PIN domain-containing protein [Aestuariivirga sp.]
MIGLDTNVIVRYIMQDDRKQSKLATALMERLTESEPGFVSLVSVTELVWVLESAYALARHQVAEVLTSLIAIDVLKIERLAVVAAAVRNFKDGTADFADCLIERSSANAGCERTVTFDRSAARTANMTLIQ